MKAEEKEELKSSFKSQSQSKREPLFKSKTLKVVREQYARLKFSLHGSTQIQKQQFNTKLVDKLVGNKLPLLNQFNFEMRDKIYKILYYKCKPSGTCLETNSFELDPQNTLLITSGYCRI